MFKGCCCFLVISVNSFHIVVLLFFCLLPIRCLNVLCMLSLSWRKLRTLLLVCTQYGSDALVKLYVLNIDWQISIKLSIYVCIINLCADQQKSRALLDIHDGVLQQ